MFFVHRIRTKRMAALALLPFAALAGSNAVALATAVTGSPTSAQPTGATAAASRVALKLADKDVLAGEKVKLEGSVAPGGTQTVEIDVNGKRVKELSTAADGHFRGGWRPETPGVYKLEAIAGGPETPVSSGHKRVNAYRAVQASYYGPGLYGGQLACGGVLTPSKLGVANKTLPCGAKVTLRHGNQTLTVPVIDRGPYAGNRVYDLTAATKSKLGFGSTGIVLATR
ncbi:MAG: septal ring lytic transglycosylase RlpA family protein [Solirubrobacterales bacterium]